MVRALITIFFCWSLLLQPAAAADSRLIVQPISNSSGDQSLDPLSTGFSDLLVAYLSAYPQLEVLYRDDMHRLWRELAQSRAGLQPDDAMRIGALVQANTLVKGGFVKVNGTFQANVHVYDIATTKLRFSFKERGKIENVDALAATMAEHIAANILNGTDSAAPLAIDTQPLVNTHFMKGLGYHFNGLYDHAVAEFMQVVDLDPSRADARLWLGKSYAAAGDDGHARIEYQRFLQDYPQHASVGVARNALKELSK